MKTLFLIFILCISSLFAKDLEFKSSKNKTNIIELYTSQGCSSCPVADKWLSKLKKNPKLFKEFIPMAFHVTYWDYIGWRDIFADKANDYRQKHYARDIWKNNSIYTPQFVINAKEYRKWFSNKSIPTFKKEYGGNLKIKIENNTISTSYYNKNIKNEKVYLNVAILGFDYKIKIENGENQNKTLHHDFVVLNHIKKVADIKNNILKVNSNFPQYNVKNNETAIVVWISEYNSNILQSVGTYLKN